MILKMEKCMFTSSSGDKVEVHEDGHKILHITVARPQGHDIVLSLNSDGNGMFYFTNIIMKNLFPGPGIWTDLNSIQDFIIEKERNKRDSR